jgi:hypothetical protein
VTPILEVYSDLPTRLERKMKEIRMPLKWFDLDGFITETLRFLDGKANYPTLAITWVGAPGRCPNDETDENWDFRSKLLTESVFLFFPLALPDMEGSFDCADGSSYLVTARDFYGEDDEEPVKEYDDDPEERFVIEDVIGALLRVDGNEMTVNLAVCPMSGCLPPPTVDLLVDGHFLERLLVYFMNRFVIRDAQEPISEEAVQRLCEECQRRSATQKPSDMKQEMKQRIKELLSEDAGKEFDVVIGPETEFKSFSVMIDTRTEDCIKRQYAYSYYERRKTLRDTYVFARGEVFAEEWEHTQTWGPKSGMNLQRAAKLFWDALDEAKQELETEGREVNLRFLENQREAH